MAPIVAGRTPLPAARVGFGGMAPLGAQGLAPLPVPAGGHCAFGAPGTLGGAAPVGAAGGAGACRGGFGGLAPLPAAGFCASPAAPSPPPSPPSPLSGRSATDDLSSLPTEARAAPPITLTRCESSRRSVESIDASCAPPRRSTVAKLARAPSHLLRGESWAALNGYDGADAFAPAPPPTPPPDEEAEAEYSLAALPDAPPAAVGGLLPADSVLIPENLARSLRIDPLLLRMINAPSSGAAASLVEKRWLELRGADSRAQLLRAGAAADIESKVRSGVGSTAALEAAMAERGAAALLDAMLPEFTRLEAHAIGEAMKEASEEDREYDGRAVEPTRSVMREALGRITLQKVEDACKQAALKALAKHMGDGISAQAAQGPVVSAVLRQLRPRVQKLCAVKLAGVLQYTICLYAAWAAELLPPQGEQATASQ
jgi:hypothetical protein